MRSLEQCYGILGVKPGVPQEQIKQAYHDLVKVWHPDRFAHDARLQAQAQEKLKEINEAYDTLTSPRAFAGGARPGPSRSYSQPPAEPVRPMKWSMEPVVSFIVLMIAIALISMVFFIYGRPYEPVHSQGSAQQAA